MQRKWKCDAIKDVSEIYGRLAGWLKANSNGIFKTFEDLFKNIYAA